MSVGLNADGRLEVFARGTDNALWHCWQTTPSAGPWSGFVSLAGTITSGPSVVRTLDRHLHVFALGPRADLWHIFQKELNGGWAPWESLGGSLTDTPAVALNEDGSIEVFARGTDGALRHNRQTPTSSWSGWMSLGGSLVGPPAVCMNGDGKLEVFAEFTDSTLQSLRQAAPNGTWLPTWDSLTGPVTKTPSPAALNADLRMEVCFASVGGELRTIWQTAAAVNNWAGPNSLGGILQGPPVIARNNDGRLEVFHIGSDGYLYNAWQTAPNGPWHGWQHMELGGLKKDGNFCVTKNGDGRLEVFALADTGDMMHTWQKLPSKGPWGFGSLGGATLGGLGVKLATMGFRAGWYFRE
jgi:acylphosphatase